MRAGGGAKGGKGRGGRGGGGGREGEGGRGGGGRRTRWRGRRKKEDEDEDEAEMQGVKWNGWTFEKLVDAAGGGVLNCRTPSLAKSATTRLRRRYQGIVAYRNVGVLRAPAVRSPTSRPLGSPSARTDTTAEQKNTDRGFHIFEDVIPPHRAKKTHNTTHRPFLLQKNGGTVSARLV